MTAEFLDAWTRGDVVEEKPSIDWEEAKRKEELIKQREREFDKMARQIAKLIKEIGSTPTPRQMKIHLDIDGKKMRAVCGETRRDPYDILVREARDILLNEEGLTIGFGRMIPAPEELKKGTLN